MLFTNSNSFLILGASGFIGTSLCKILDELQIDYVGLGYTNRSNSSTYFDISKPEAIPASLIKGRIVVHLASSLKPSRYSHELFAQVTQEVNYFQRLLAHCLQSRSRKFIYISSGGCVYGHSYTQPIDETVIPRPINLYGYFKLSIENLLNLYYSVFDFDFISLRVSNCYGPGQVVKQGQGVIAAFTHSIKNKVPITIYGDGSISRDYLFVTDLCNAIILASTAPSHSCNTYNVSYGESYSLKYLLGCLSEISNTSPIVNYEPSRSFDALTVSLDSSLFRNEFSWDPKISLYDGLVLQFKG